MNVKMDPEGHYPQNNHFTLHYFEWHSDHNALFQSKISAMPEILGNILDWNVFVNFVMF